MRKRLVTNAVEPLDSESVNDAVRNYRTRIMSSLDEVDQQAWEGLLAL